MSIGMVFCDFVDVFLFLCGNVIFKEIFCGSVVIMIFVIVFVFIVGGILIVLMNEDV